MYDFNLLPRAEQLKVNRKANSFSKYCFIMSFLIFFFGGIHLVAGSLFKILDNSSEISKLAGITQDVQSKEQLIQAFQGKVGRVSGQVTTSNYFGENKKTTAELIASLSSNIPKNVRLTKFEISDKRQVEIDGIAKNDQSIIQMIDKFSESETVKEAKLNNVANFTEEDRTQLYSETGKPAPKTFPNEDITKKFSATIAMAPVKGEKFDNFKVLDIIMKKKR